eukprot:130229_1
MMYCQLLYEHKFIVPFDMKTFVKTIENKSDLLIIFCTQFNHIISLFINQRIHQRVLDCKMFALLLRSQFVNDCQISNIDGNEVFGGIVHTKGGQYCDVQLKRIQVYQMFC